MILPCNTEFSVEMWLWAILADDFQERFCLGVFSLTARDRTYLTISSIKAVNKTLNRLSNFLKVYGLLQGWLKKRKSVNIWNPLCCLEIKYLVPAPFTAVHAGFEVRSITHKGQGGTICLRRFWRETVSSPTWSLRFWQVSFIEWIKASWQCPPVLMGP